MMARRMVRIMGHMLSALPSLVGRGRLQRETMHAHSKWSQADTGWTLRLRQKECHHLWYSRHTQCIGIMGTTTWE